MYIRRETETPVAQLVYVNLFSVLMNNAVHGLLGAENQCKHTENDNENVLPDDIVAATESDVPVGNNFDEGGRDEAEDGEAEGPDDTHEGRDGRHSNSKHHANRHQDRS